MSTPPIGRFAPSPTGPLHLGSLLAAVASWLDARAGGGHWLVRIEDIDPPREQPGATKLILAALEAHGLIWDGEPLLQSTRLDAYQAALETLADAGLLFRCTCTRRQIQASGGVYPGTCREHGMQPLPAGRSHAVRVRVPAGRDAVVRFHDRLRGELTFDLEKDVGDFVVRRRDGLIAYQLAVVVDDAAQGVTDVVRGIDLIDSTPRQIHLQRALELPPVRYLHLPLLIDGRGSKLSKQTGATGLDLNDPRANLARVLDWLGLPSDACRPVRAQLERALAVYDPNRLPLGPIAVE